MQSNDYFAQRRFSASAFPYHAQRLAFFDGEANVVERVNLCDDAVEQTTAFGEMFDCVFDTDQNIARFVIRVCVGFAHDAAPTSLTSPMG